MIGYESISEAGVIWRRHHGALVPLQMPDVVSDSLDKSGLSSALIRNRCAFARWEESFDQFDGGEWWHVIKDEPESLELRGKKTRNQIRRGAKEFTVEPVAREVILSEGYAVYLAAFQRYDTFEEVLSEPAFREAISSLPDETEFWSVRDKDTHELVAFSENLVRDGACFYVSMWFQPEAMKRYAGYVLFYEMNRHYLNDRNLRYVSDGARSISHQTNIHDFLMQKFGFRYAYAKLRVVYAPGVGLAVRVLYPFREWFFRGSSSLSQKLAVLLEQERIRRSFLSSGD